MSQRSLLHALTLSILWPPLAGRAETQASDRQSLLRPTDYAHYIPLFEAQERAATGGLYNGEPASPGQPAEAAWPWMRREIPWFDSSDKAFEEMYYFRWYAWKKHLVHTHTGYVITEWLPKPDFKDGSFGALPDAAPFHLGEARWLRTRAIAEDDARFWYRPATPTAPAPDIRKYSAAMATAVRDVTLANGDTALATTLLPDLVRVYRDWERTQQDSNGLFWSIDTRDAMEKSISGDGYRPTLNSYLVADARAIAVTARLAGNDGLATEFDGKADTLQAKVESTLWNPKDGFYEVVSPAADSGIRVQKKFVDPGSTLQLSGTRELIGYNPWFFSSPTPAHAVAWAQLFDPDGFNARFGATTAERRSPRFRFASSDQCTWNGPAWPFAMTQTLNALAAFQNSAASTAPSGLPPGALYILFSRYVLAQHLTLAAAVAGQPARTIDWIDEDYDADTGDWIAKRMLLAKNKQIGRGNYYNHSGFADPLITGLIGLRPRADNHVSVHPLLPSHQWTYFALDRLPYHGHLLTLAWDATGKRYGRGIGFTLLIDGHLAAHRPTLGPLEADLPQ